MGHAHYTRDRTQKHTHKPTRTQTPEPGLQLLDGGDDATRSAVRRRYTR